MAIAVTHFGERQHMRTTGAVDRTRRYQPILDLSAVGTAIHAQRTANRAGNAAKERQAGDACLLRHARNFHVRHRRTNPQAIIAFRHNRAEPAAKPHHNARNAPVAHNQVRAKANDGDGNFRRQGGKKITQIGFILRHEQHLRRTADTKPSERRERFIRQ